MTPRRFVFILIVLLAMLAGSSSRVALGEQQPLMGDVVLVDELCAPPGASAPSKPFADTEIGCPKTGASVCVCFMSSRTVECPLLEMPADLRPVKLARLPRPGRKPRILPEPTLESLKESLPPAPPTPPPRTS
jgi:hypothetical protein